MKKFTLTICFALVFCVAQTINAQAPTTSPISPEYDATDVICFYNGSQKYLQATDLSLLPWGEPSTYDFAETDDGEEVMIVEDLGWLPIGLAKRQAGVADMEYMHVDVYCNEETYFQIGFQGYGDGGSETYFPGFTYNTPGEWYGIDFPLSIMTEQGFNLGLTNVLRIGGGEGTDYSSEIYIDNMFVFVGEPTNLYDGSTSIISQVKKENLLIYPSVVSSTFSVNAERALSNVDVYDITGQIVASFENSFEDLNISMLDAGTYIVAVKLANGIIVPKKIVKK